MDDKYIDEKEVGRVMNAYVKNQFEIIRKDQAFTLEINGELIDITDIKFMPDETKIIAVYHDQPGFGRE